MILRYDYIKDTILSQGLMILYSGPYKILCSQPNSYDISNTQLFYLLLCLVVTHCLYAQHMAAPYSSFRFLQKGHVFSWPSPFDHHCLVQGWTLIQAGPAQVACLLNHGRLAYVWESDWVWATKFFSPVFLIGIRKSSKSVSEVQSFKAYNSGAVVAHAFLHTGPY